MAKKNWPKTADGTTDWEEVFENATSGFVPLIAQARTAAALGQCTKLVINELFTRDSDGAMVERFTADLDLIVSGVTEVDELAETRERAIGLLREIKADRLQRAEAYVARKKSKAAGERRHVKKSGKLKPLSSVRKVEAFQKYHKRIVAFCLVLLLVCAGAVVFLTDLPKVVFPGDGGEAKTVVDPAPELPPAEAPEQAPAKPENGEAAPSPTLLPDEASWPVVVLRPIHWSIDLPRRKRGTIAYLPRLRLVSKDQSATVCRMWPRIFDTLNLTFNKLHPKGHRATDADLSGMESDAVKSINALFDKTTVRSVELVPHGDPEFRVTSTFPCRLIGEK